MYTQGTNSVPSYLISARNAELPLIFQDGQKERPISGITIWKHLGQLEKPFAVQSIVDESDFQVHL